MIKNLLLLCACSSILQANIKPENVIASGCLKSYQAQYQDFKEHKVFVYAREAQTGKDRCGWNYNNPNLEDAKMQAMKQCTDHPLDAPCVIVDIDGKFLVKKGDFSHITPADDTALTPAQLTALKKRAKTEIAGSCYPFFEKYLDKKGHKAFSYTLDHEGLFACGDIAKQTSQKSAEIGAKKGCQNHKNLLKTNAPKTDCKPYAVGNTIVAKKEDFSHFSPIPDNTLTKAQKQTIMKEAKKTITGNCLPFFEKHLDYKGHKSFAYAIDKTGKFSCGQSNGHPSKTKADKDALDFCAKDHPKKHPTIPCKIYSQGNKILLSLKDYQLSREEDILKKLSTPKRDALYEEVAMFIDSSSCRSALRIYLYPHQQQAFYAAISKDGKQACGWSYAKFSLEEAHESAKKECEVKKKKLKVTAACKPLFVNLKVKNHAKDFGIVRGKKDYKNALSHGNLLKIQSYIDENMDVNTVNKDGTSALFVAAAQGDNTLFKTLIQKGANIKQLAHGSNSILIAAAAGGNPNIVRYVLKQGLDINQKGDDDNTALHAAFMTLKTYIVAILMQEGADATLKNAKGYSAYDLAKKWKMDIDILKKIEPKKSDSEGTFPLFYAAKEGDVEGIKKLLALGADINNADSAKRSPLGYAHESVIAMLIKAGADINHQDEDGETPLMVNVYQPSTAKLLLKLGADKSIKDKEGHTAYDKVKDDKGVSDTMKRLLKP